ncbi:hypothetical protein [Streptomyces globisporus]
MAGEGQAEPVDGGPVEAVVQVIGGNGIGRHVTGTVTIALPRKGEGEA